MHRPAVLATVAVCFLTWAIGADVQDQSQRQNGPAKKKLSVAIVGGGVAGTVTALELLTRAQVTRVTIFEHGPQLGHNKSASGIIAAILGFASSHKYWDHRIPFLKVEHWLAMRLEAPSVRGWEFGQYMAHLRMTNDRRLRKRDQLDFFKQSRQRLEELLDRFPELCGAIVGPFCCRQGSTAAKWMGNHSNTRKYGVSCTVVSGVGHAFETRKNAAIQDDPAARAQRFTMLTSGNSKKEINSTEHRIHRPSLRNLEALLRQDLYAGLWNDEDEGFVRVEDFYPIAVSILLRSGVRIVTSCDVRHVQPVAARASAARPRLKGKLEVITSYACKGGTFDRVIVAAGASSVNLMRRHDRSIPQQLVPVKGYAVAADVPLFSSESRQIGIEYEDLGHYIRAQSNGGVRYGFGRELGTFDDQLLDPSFEGWQSHTGPHQTGLGRMIMDSPHVELAGFRPLSVFLKFPLLKRYKGEWSGLLVNTGFGFYGYGMAWKSAALVVDLALGDDPHDWAGAWDEEFGPLICPWGTFMLFDCSLIAALVCALLVITTYILDSPATKTALEQQMDNDMLDDEDRKALATDFGYVSGNMSLAERYGMLNAQASTGLLTKKESDSARLLLVGMANENKAKVLVDNVDNTVHTSAVPNERLVEMCAQCNLYVIIHYAMGLVALVLALFGWQTAVLVLTICKASAGAFFQHCWLARLVKWSDDSLPPDVAHLRIAFRPADFYWHLFRSSLDACDHDVDGAIAGQALAMGLSAQGWGALGAGTVQSHLVWARSHYQQQWQCFPVVGFCFALLGPYFALPIHCAIVNFSQSFIARRYFQKAADIVPELKSSDNVEDWKKNWETCDEFWRQCTHGLDLAGMFLIQRVTEELTNIASNTMQVKSLRACGQPNKRTKGRYGKTTVFILKVIVESAGALVLLTSTASVTLDFLTTPQVAMLALSVATSSVTILENVVYQLHYHSDIKNNMMQCWYKWPGFAFNRLSVAFAAGMLLSAWVKIIGMFLCPSHVLGVGEGCIEWETVELYSLQWQNPCQEVVIFIAVVSLACIGVAVRFWWLWCEQQEKLAGAGSTTMNMDIAAVANECEQ